jgi:hypothetical protein
MYEVIMSAFCWVTLSVTVMLALTAIDLIYGSLTGGAK